MSDVPAIPHAAGAPAGGWRSEERHRAISQIPAVHKAGSASSPAVFSPDGDCAGEEDFFSCGPAIPCASDGILTGLQSPPVASTSLPLFSPSEFDGQLPERQMDLVFGPACPVDAELPTPPQERPRQLQLPSFSSLGIANPHPDGLSPSDKVQLEPIGGLSFPPREDCPPQQPPQHCLNCTSPTRHPLGIPADLAVLTPPDESRPFQWASTGPEEAPEPTDRRLGDDVQPSIPTIAADVLVPEISDVPEASSVQQAESSIEEATNTRDVLQPAIDAVLSDLIPSLVSSNALKVLSHALPSPSIPGHLFPSVIEGLRENLPNSDLTWISILHAVPGRYNLSELPVSPPNTPGIALGGREMTEDYFMTKTFESAIPVTVDYAANDLASTMRYQALAPPSSINLCIVERYIPPTSLNEFRNLFSVTRPSLLVDRLAEIVPGGGSLLFIYPTRKGANDFCSEYLGPVLDPLLRSMVVVNNFTADLSGSIGRMSAAGHMHDYAALSQKIHDLCEDLSNQSNPQIARRLHGDGGRFKVTYAQKHRVSPQRQVWASWWEKQEKQRVRMAVSQHFRLANRYMADSDQMPATLIQQILDGVLTGPYPPGREPTGGIEVGVFVIRRSKT